MLLLACGDKSTTTSDTADTGSDQALPGDPNSPESDTGDGDNEDTGETDSEMPENPAPFTVSLSDGREITFDLPSCQHFRGSPNFRMFWRDSAQSHTYVLTMQVMSTFDGAGVYASDSHNVQVKLQEEAPVTGAPYYATDGEQGDTVSLEVVYIDEEIAWGSATASTIHSNATTDPLTITPSSLPIWCPDVEI